MKLRLTANFLIGLLFLVLVVVGAGLAAVFQNLGLTFIDWGGSILITYLIVNILVVRDERKRWKAVETDVKRSLSKELNGILIDMISLISLGVVRPAMSMEGTEAEIRARANQMDLDELRQLAADRNLLAQRVQMSRLLGFGGLFLDRAETFASLQIRYWSRFVEPETMSLLINLESSLRTLDTLLGISRRYASEDLTDRPFTEVLASTVPDGALEVVQGILSLLVNAVDQRVIVMS